MEEKEKNKILIGSIILVITLILVVVGTTYAFFSLQIKNSSEPTNIEITTGEQNKITLNGGLTNYHIHLKVSDMSLDNIGKSYYGTTDTGKDYELTEELGTKELGNITVSGELEDNYVCNATININLEGEMQEHLQQNDLVLVIKQGDTTNTYDLSEVISNPTFKFNISNSNIEPIKAYLKFTNQNTDQSLLAGKELNISINIDDFACEISVGKEPLEMLREHATGGEEAVTFIEEDVDGMYRYKGTTTQVTNNYICFGTDNTETCLDTPDNYMYRIIGITDKEDNTINIPANSLKLIKAIPIETSFDDSFITASKWENENKWKEIIISHKIYNAYQTYGNFNVSPLIELKTSWTDYETKLSLMYASDYANAYRNKSTENWLFITNRWLGNSFKEEWTDSFEGFDSDWTYKWMVEQAGNLSPRMGGEPGAMSPVFYVSPNITLTGEGNAESPFIIHTT